MSPTPARTSAPACWASSSAEKSGNNRLHKSTGLPVFGKAGVLFVLFSVSAAAAAVARAAAAAAFTAAGAAARAEALALQNGQLAQDEQVGGLVGVALKARDGDNAEA